MTEEPQYNIPRAKNAKEAILTIKEKLIHIRDESYKKAHQYDLANSPHNVEFMRREADILNDIIFYIEKVEPLEINTKQKSAKSAPKKDTETTYAEIDQQPTLIYPA